MPEELKMDRNLALEAVRVTEAAALSASRLMGRGDEKAADQAAVDAMRKALNSLAIEGTVVIGEGERDEAPMLFIGEKVGTGQGPKIDIALDPLEGTTITAKGAANALAVSGDGRARRLSQRARRLHGQDRGRRRPARRMSSTSTREPADEPANLARAKKLDVADLVVCILDRPRHAELIAKVREAGARIMLIGDGDVSRRHGDLRPGDRDRHLHGFAAARRRACWRRRRCAASAARCRAGCCSATTTSAAGRTGSASPT